MVQTGRVHPHSGEEQNKKDEKKEVTKILSSRLFLWSLTRTVWQSWPSQWTGETMTWCIVVRWVMASTYCLLPIAYCPLPIDMVYGCEVSNGYYLLRFHFFFCKLWKFLLKFSNIHNVLVSKQMQIGDFFQATNQFPPVSCVSKYYKEMNIKWIFFTFYISGFYSQATNQAQFPPVSQRTNFTVYFEPDRCRKIKHVHIFSLKLSPHWTR